MLPKLALHVLQLSLFVCSVYFLFVFSLVLDYGSKNVAWKVVTLYIFFLSLSAYHLICFLLFHLLVGVKGQWKNGLFLQWIFGGPCHVALLFIESDRVVHAHKHTHACCLFAFKWYAHTAQTRVNGYLWCDDAIYRYSLAQTKKNSQAFNEAPVSFWWFSTYSLISFGMAWATAIEIQMTRETPAQLNGCSIVFKSNAITIPQCIQISALS